MNKTEAARELTSLALTAVTALTPSWDLRRALATLDLEEAAVLRLCDEPDRLEVRQAFAGGRVTLCLVKHAHPRTLLRYALAARSLGFSSIEQEALETVGVAGRLMKQRQYALTRRYLEPVMDALRASVAVPAEYRVLLEGHHQQSMAKGGR